jgi:hypothetical protein
VLKVPLSLEPLATIAETLDTPLKARIPPATRALGFKFHV